MPSFQILLTTLLAVPAVLAAPSKKLATRQSPTAYSGPVANFPTMDTWATFDAILSANTADMIAKGSTQQDVDNISTAIQSVSATQGADPRVILAMVIQESTGYVGVGTTTDADGAGTGGLMQASGCPAFPGQNNLSLDDIESMISCGTTHFMGNCQDQGGQDTVDTIYPALREYNSGTVDPSDLSTGPNQSTPSYVSDIANRLQGVVF